MTPFLRSYLDEVLEDLDKLLHLFEHNSVLRCLRGELRQGGHRRFRPNRHSVDSSRRSPRVWHRSIGQRGASVLLPAPSSLPEIFLRALVAGPVMAGVPLVALTGFLVAHVAEALRAKKIVLVLLEAGRRRFFFISSSYLLAGKLVSLVATLVAAVEGLPSAVAAHVRKIGYILLANYHEFLVAVEVVRGFPAEAEGGGLDLCGTS